MATRRHTFIVQLWIDEDGRTYGQVRDPQDGWRRPFHNATELWALILERMTQLQSSTDQSYATQNVIEEGEADGCA
ncbi:hypothetical protein KFU94_39220 [Chloroflexi bacterium TSY]|nr:hypothetical protein [Chloroflexi bacterium TSY]